MRSLLVAAAALAVCAACATAPEVPLYDPPIPLPVRIAVKTGSNLLSQNYGPGVLRAWGEMKLFERLVHPPDAFETVDATLGLSIERAPDGEQILLRLHAGKVNVFRHEAVIPGLSGENWQELVKTFSNSVVRAHAREIANSSARDLVERQAEIVPRMRNAR